MTTINDIDLSMWHDFTRGLIQAPLWILGVVFAIVWIIPAISRSIPRSRR